MIVFDLRCGDEHVFEAWFASSAAYESQRERGLIACPMCGDAEIGKAVMAPAVGAKGNQSAAHAGLLAAQRRMEAESDYVGGEFAAKARARAAEIDAGDVPPRAIYGEATAAEARELIDEGIAVMPLPFMPLIRSDA